MRPRVSASGLWAIALLVAVAGCGSGSPRADGAADDASLADADGAGNDDTGASLRDAGDAVDRPDAAASADVVDAPMVADASNHADAPGPSDGPLNARYVFKIPMLAERMVGDPLRRRLYVSIAGASPQYPNSLLTFDANTGAVVANTYVGSNPRSLALSDDSSVIWIGIDGALAIRRVTLTADPPAIGPLTPLLPVLGAGQTIGPMIVLPGAPLSVIVSTPDGGKTFVLDDAVARSTAALTLGRRAPLMAAGAPGYVYGYDDEDTGFGFLTMGTSPSGVADLSTTGGLIQGFGNQIVYQGGHVYAATGEVVDVSVPTHPVKGGQLPGVGRLAVGPSNRLFLLSGDKPDASTNYPTQILVVDGTTLKVVSTIPVPPDLFGMFGDSPAATSLVYLGPDTLALLIRLTNSTTYNQSGTLVIIRDPLIAAIN